MYKRQFDACHAGVVLRACGGLAALWAAVALFLDSRLAMWPGNFALLVAISTPGLFIWLIVACLSKAWSARWPRPVQWVWGMGLGAACAALSYAVSVWLDLAPKGYVLGSAAAGLLVAAGLVAGLVWRARALMPAATKARLMELQSRIRPHFLFNALNSAIALVRDNPKQAERVLEDLSEVFRAALAETASDVSLADEIELARSYLNIEQVRFGPRMQVEWALDESAHGARLPPLALQPLVENAVKHGVERASGITHVKVSTQRRGGMVVVRVTNTLDAAAAPDRAGQGIALANVRERLALLHDVHASFQARAKDGVFQARIEVPLSR